MPSRYDVIVGTDFQRAANALRVLERTISGRLHRRMNTEAEKLVEAAQSKVRVLPTPQNAGHTGLRARVASGVHIANRGALLRVQTTMTDSDEAIIPRGLDRGARGWRHPVFGNRDNWVRQNGYSWFMETMESGQRPMENALTDELEDAANLVDGAS